MDEKLPPPILGPWSEAVVLSAHGGGGQLLSPERAYFGMPEDAKLAAAIVDATIWNYWGWASTILLGILGEKQPTTNSKTQDYFEERKWKTIEDAYDEANVTKNQRLVFDLYLAGFNFREIAEIMDLSGENPTMTAQMQIIRTKEKLRRICGVVEEKGL